jgi:16S rRNA (cytosine967-C5)-methyltransferase
MSMTPAARLQAAIDILAALDGTQQPVDRYLKDFFRARRYAGSKDRRAISELVFDVMRHRSSLAHRMGSGSARALVTAALLASGDDPTARFTGGYGPEPLSDAERATIAAPPSPAPPHVAGEYPPWLEASLTRAFGDDLLPEMTALQARAPVDLRVNTLKANRPAVLAALQAEGFSASPTPHSPVGIRIPPGEGNATLTKSSLFLSGAFEFQDEAAQMASLLADAKPGMRVLDLAAGSGGKALALAAAMNNDGHILAFDDVPKRLAPLRERVERAGATCIQQADKRGGPIWGDGKFDIVFLDAPCSGTGTWRRQPELRWRLTPERLAELTRLQDWLLDDAARHTAPGGRLVYATCSLLPEENEDRVAAFLARTPGFSRARPVDFRASPAKTGTDGFFAAVLEHT